MSLEDWRKLGWLKEHKTSQEEIGNLFAIADRDLAASQTPDLIAEWRFNIAYNAGLQLATAALAASGYQASRAAHHYRVIQSLAFTLNLPTAELDTFDGFRRKRNVADYERAEVVSETEVEDMIALAQQLRTDVEAWMRRHHAQYLS
jgi:hypothetical protein